MRQAITTTTWSDMSRRMLTIAIGAPIIIACIVLGSPFLDAVVLFCGVAVALELDRMLRPSHGVGLPHIYSLMLATLVFVVYLPDYIVWYPVIILALTALSLLVSLWQQIDLQTTIMRNTLYPVLGALYVAIPLALMLEVRDAGLLWISVLVWNTWFTDSWALIGGRVFGRHKLAPLISPGKTIEGALIGIVFGTVAGMVILIFAGKPILFALGVNLMISMLTVVGDLFESALKRFFSVKDSGIWLPGHGGFLDRLDGFLVSAPIYYVILLVMGFVQI